MTSPLSPSLFVTLSSPSLLVGDSRRHRREGVVTKRSCPGEAGA